jgi:hypothetical protein
LKVLKNHPYRNLRELQGVQYAVVAQDPNWFLSFPDVGISDHQEYLCTFTRASSHGGFSRAIMLSKSQDGLNWDKGEIIGAPRNPRYSLFKKFQQRLLEYDCSKIMNMGNGRLEISVALSDPRENITTPMLYRFKSNDDGRSWQPPIADNCQGIMQDICIINRNNPQEWIFGIHCKDKKTGALKQRLFRSLDGGKSWEKPEIIAFDGRTDFCEVSITYVPNSNVILAFMRDNRAVRSATLEYKHGYPSQFTFSTDFGRHWASPIEIPIYGHRPVAKFLEDGRIMVTYRDICDLGVTGLWIASINTKYLNLISQTDSPNVDFQSLFTNQKYYVIEHEDENNLHGDNGYTGWIQNPVDKSVVIVYYTKVGAPYLRAYIKSVKFNPSVL